MQRAHARIAAPGKRELRDAARADHLVVDQIRSHADQREIAPLLTNDFVAGRKRNQVRETFQRQYVAVVDIFLNRFFKGQ